jgi:hypothetical protein
MIVDEHATLDGTESKCRIDGRRRQRFCLERGGAVPIAASLQLLGIVFAQRALPPIA